MFDDLLDMVGLGSTKQSSSSSYNKGFLDGGKFAVEMLQPHIDNWKLQIKLLEEKLKQYEHPRN